MKPQGSATLAQSTPRTMGPWSLGRICQGAKSTRGLARVMARRKQTGLTIALTDWCGRCTTIGRSNSNSNKTPLFLGKPVKKFVLVVTAFTGACGTFCMASITITNMVFCEKTNFIPHICLTKRANPGAAAKQNSELKTAAKNFQKSPLKNFFWRRYQHFFIFLSATVFAMNRKACSAEKL